MKVQYPTFGCWSTCTHLTLFAYPNTKIHAFLARLPPPPAESQQYDVLNTLRKDVNTLSDALRMVSSVVDGIMSLLMNMAGGHGPPRQGGGAVPGNLLLQPHNNGNHVVGGGAGVVFNSSIGGGGGGGSGRGGTQASFIAAPVAAVHGGGGGGGAGDGGLVQWGLGAGVGGGGNIQGGQDPYLYGASIGNLPAEQQVQQQQQQQLPWQGHPPHRQQYRQAVPTAQYMGPNQVG